MWSSRNARAEQGREREKKHNKNNRISFIPLSFPPLFSFPLPAVITSLPLQASSCLSRLRVYRSVLSQQSPALTSRCCCRSHPARRRLSCSASGFNRPEESVLEAIYSRQMTTSLLLDVSAADCGLLFVIVCCYFCCLVLALRWNYRLAWGCFRCGGITELTFAI